MHAISYLDNFDSEPNHHFFLFHYYSPMYSPYKKTKQKTISNRVSQPTSSQPDLAQSINHADCTLVLWQVLGARVRAFLI